MTVNLIELKGEVSPGYPTDQVVFYSPREGVAIHNALAKVLQSARHSILLNMYGYDDDQLDQIIREKMNDPNIYVQMSLDSSQAAGVHEKALIAKWPQDSLGTTIAVGRSAKHAISHLKVLIVDGIYMVSGSTNWSLSGEEAQDNQLTISAIPALAAEATAVLNINHAEMLRQMHAAKA